MADKLGVSEKISARLADVRIVEREQEEVQSENNPFRKLVHSIRKMFSFFDMM